jgi:hypothetical protein
MCSELAGWAVQLTTEYANITRRVERQRHPITGYPADFQNNVITHVNPFTNFTT